MTKAEKNAVIDDLKGKLSDVSFLYLADTSGLTVDQINNLRGLCFEKGVQVQVVKNTLLKKAMEAISTEEKTFEGLYESLAGPTAIFTTEQASSPAKIMKEFRADHDKPVLKAAYIDSDIFVGDEQIERLAKLKSKEDLIGEILTLLQSPHKTVISALNSGGATISGLLKALEQRNGEN